MKYSLFNQGIYGQAPKQYSLLLQQAIIKFAHGFAMEYTRIPTVFHRDNLCLLGEAPVSFARDKYP